MTAALIIALLVLAVAVLAGVAFRFRRRAMRLDRLLDDTNDKLERLQIQFGRFAPSDVIEQLTEPDAHIAPNRRTVTVLFADIQEFTTLCDRMDPAEIVPILNGYFQCMSRAITEHHGRVTELTGDGLLALFGALESNPWKAQDAVLAALDMRKALAEYNERLAARDAPQLRFGIGIHQGEVVAGVMGNHDLSKFGVVGDTINVAARVEGLTRTHEVDLLITDEVRRSLDARFRLRGMPPMPVKGKPEPIVTYFVERLEEALPARAEG